MRRRLTTVVTAGVLVPLVTGAVVALLVTDGSSKAHRPRPPRVANPSRTTTVHVAPPTDVGVKTPVACPVDAVMVTPGYLPSMARNTSYCFASGTYMGLSITPKDGDRFYGHGHATLNGEGSVAEAFDGSASDLLIDGFTITNYSEPAKDQQPGVINIASGSNITISDNVVGPDQTVGISIGAGCSGYGQEGSDVTITHNTVRDVGASGISADCLDNATVSYNEVSSTNLWNLDNEDDVHAVGKCAYTEELSIIGNYVHNNAAHGIWCDVYAIDVTIADNTVTDNLCSGIFYEISYNATIQDNTITGNGWGKIGAEGTPGAGISISSAGWSDGPGAQPSEGQAGPHGIIITDNKLLDNHEGIVLYDGHSLAVPVNNVAVSRNTTTISDTQGDAYAAANETGQTGENVTWTANTYTLAVNQFIANYLAGNTDWGGWQAAGYDLEGSCQYSNGNPC